MFIASIHLTTIQALVGAVVAALIGFVGATFGVIYTARTARKHAVIQWQRDRLLPVMADLLKASQGHRLQALMTVGEFASPSNNTDPEIPFEVRQQLRVITSEIRSYVPTILVLGDDTLGIAVEAFVEFHRELDEILRSLAEDTLIALQQELLIERTAEIFNILESDGEFDLVNKTKVILGLPSFTSRKRVRFWRKWFRTSARIIATKAYEKVQATSPPDQPSVPSAPPTVES